MSGLRLSKRLLDKQNIESNNNKKIKSVDKSNTNTLVKCKPTED